MNIGWKSHTCPALERALREQKVFWVPGGGAVARALPGCRGGRGRPLDRCPYCNSPMKVQVRS